MSENAPAGGEWKRTSPLGIVPGIFTTLRSLVLPLAALAYSMRGAAGELATALAGVALVLGLVGAVCWVRWRQFRYLVGAEDIRVEQGLLGRQARSVPFERIQDVSLEEALIPRLLGLVAVRFETGAGGSDEIALAYVTGAEGERLRETVKARREEGFGADGARPETVDGAPGAAQGQEPKRLLFALAPRRLLIFGLFEFSLVVFAVLAGAAQQLDFLLPFDIWDPDEWPQILSGSGALLAQLGIAAQVAGAVLGLMALALVGLATGVVRTVLRDWGFRLEQTAKGLRRRRGLLTRTDVVMPLHRVQALTIATGIVRRRFGWHSLSIVSLAQDKGSASHVAVPFGTMEEIARVTRATGFALPAPDAIWRRLSIAHRVHGALLCALPLLLASATLLLAPPFLLPAAPELAPIAAALVAGAGLLALWQLFLWRHERYLLDERHIHARRGWLAPRLDISARAKVQSVEIVQGPLARRGGYATLRLGIAGGMFDIAGLPLGEACRLRAEVLRSVSRVDFSQLSAPELPAADNGAAPINT